jgi:hypothetical protein
MLTFSTLFCSSSTIYRSADILVGNLERKRSIGKHRCMWEDNIKMELVMRTISEARNFACLNEAFLVRMIKLTSTAARVGWLAGRPDAARAGSIV